MTHLDDLPLELLFLLTSNLDPFDLFSLLSACRNRGSYHEHRQGRYGSNQNRVLELIYGICTGRLDLIKKIPRLPKLLEQFDDYATWMANSDRHGLLGGDEKDAKAFANIDFGGYINPLILAITQKSQNSRRGLDILRFLLDNGANPNTPDKFRRRYPIYIATEKQDVGSVSLLLARQACPNMCNFQNEQLPLDVASEQNHIELVTLLLDHGGELNSRPFHFRALPYRQKSLQSLETLKLLVTRGKYNISDQAILHVFRWMLPRINLPTRRSPRIQKQRRDSTLDISSLTALVASIKSEDPNSLQSQWNLYSTS